MRTDDTDYGVDYWSTLDNGAGYRDSVMWQDLAFIVKDVFGFEGFNDIGGSVHHLDVGCASGWLSKHLRLRGVDSFGCDFSTYALEHTEDYIAPYLKWCDITEDKDLPNWSGVGFNLVTCFETMEHIPEENVDDVLRRIYDRLDSGGYALFAICLDDRPGWDSDPTHVTIKSRAWWDERFARLDWHPDDQRYARVKSFHLCAEHNGVFVMRKS